MRLTKHAHACVEIDVDDAHLLIDPGKLTPDATALIARTSTVLLTHEHPDHVDTGALEAALGSRDDLRVHGPAAALGDWPDRFPDRVAAVAPGDALRIDGVDVTVHGGLHAVIHPDLPRFTNVGYLVGGRLLHPGDSYEVPDVDVEVLLLPVSGPWMKLAEAVDFVRAVDPRRVVGIHERAASDFGLMLLGSHFRPGGLVDIELEMPVPGESLQL